MTCIMCGCKGVNNVWTKKECEVYPMGDSYLQYAHDRLRLCLSVRVADVDNMEKDLCVLDLLKCCPDGRMQMERGSK